MSFVEKITEAEATAQSVVEKAKESAKSTIEQTESDIAALAESHRTKRNEDRASKLQSQKDALKKEYKEVLFTETESISSLEAQAQKSHKGAVAHILKQLQ